MDKHNYEAGDIVIAHKDHVNNNFRVFNIVREVVDDQIFFKQTLFPGGIGCNCTLSSHFNKMATLVKKSKLTYLLYL